MARSSKRKYPPTVRIALFATGAIAIALFLMGLAQGDGLLFIAALLTAILLWGLAWRQKWAYVLTFILIIVAVAFLITRAQYIEAGATAAITALVWIPLLIAANWFWPHTRHKRAHA